MTLIGCEKPQEAQEFLSIMNAVTNGKPETQILNLTEAEIVKLLVNCFVTMKISFANFIGELTSLFPETDKHKVAKALGLDTRIGGKYLRPGFGFAGPCFPRDNKALIALSNNFGLKPSLGLATDEINDRQPEQVFSQLIGKYPKAKRIGIVGLTYKPHTRVLEESQSLKLYEIIKSNGLQVALFDPLLLGTVINGVKVASSMLELSDCDVLVVSKGFEFALTPEIMPIIETYIV
jgi:UDPglucose 6-dehydrogenase